MPTANIYLTNENWERLKKEDNKSGIINMLLSAHWIKAATDEEKIKELEPKIEEYKAAVREYEIRKKIVDEKEQAIINEERERIKHKEREEKERAALAKIWDNWADYEEEYTSKGKSGKYAFAKEKAAELVNNELNKTVSGA